MRLTAPLSLVVLLLAAAIAAAGGREGQSTPTLTASAAAGSVSLTNSAGSGAILEVAGLAPGGSASGEVTITNEGTLAGALGLATSGLADTPGRGGGLLSQRLQLVVYDLGGGTVYSGPLAGLGTRALGDIGAGEARTYRLTATMPDGGPPAGPLAGDNSYQGASTTTAFVWTATWSDPGAGGGGNGGPGGDGSTGRFAIQLRLPRKQPGLGKRRVVVSVTCNQTCSLAARMRMTRKGRPRGAVTGAARKAGVPANVPTKLTLRMSARAARKIGRAMRTRKGAHSMLQVTARAPGGTVNVKRGVRLKKRGKKVTAAWMKLPAKKPKKNRAKR